MTTYTTIPDSDIDPESPGTTTLFTRLRDNPIAITEGSVGAPNIQDAALDITVTAAGTTWVTNRIAGAAAGDVGTYIFAQGSTSDVAFGSTIAGSSLNPTSAAQLIDSAFVGGSESFTLGAAQSGTWRCMGTYDYASTGTASNVHNGATLWLRIA